MDTHNWLAEEFEARRAHLRAVAYRVLGSSSEADDAVQEAWLRLSRTERGSVENLQAWLTTVVARICLDMLRARAARREEPLDDDVPKQFVSRTDESDPEHAALQADSVGLALLVILNTLNPSERLAFVLHDIFGVPFDEIVPIVGCSLTATRQLASRARRRVRGTAITADTDLTRQREVVDAFLRAARNGDFNALLAVLDPDIVFRADQTAVSLGGPSEVYGATAVAKQFAGRAQAARPALVNGAVGVVVAPRGQVLLVLSLTILHGRIIAISAVADAEQLRQFNLTVLDVAYATGAA